MADGWKIDTLDNGLRVLTTSIPTAQSAAVAFFAGVGSRDEQPKTNGLSHYIEHMLFKGTATRPDAAQISEAIEGAGGSLNAYTTKELTCYWNNLPFERAETGIEVLADMIQHSLIEPEELERERTVVQQEIRRAHDSPGQFVGELLGRAIYGDQPIGWPVAGSLETVGEIQRDDFMEHMAGFYRAGNTVLSVAGNIEHAQVVEWAARYFTDLPGGDAPEAASSRWGLPEEHLQIAERELEQTNLALSMQAIARRDPDRYALDIMNTALGRGMSSRLFKEVRERRGLAYSVSSGAARYQDIGTMTVSAGVTREHQEEALRVILAELRKLVDEPMGEAELQRTKDYAVGSFRLSLETPMALGQRWGNQLLQDGEIEPPDVTVERLRAVTAEDIQRVAQRVIGPGAYALAVVGPSASADRLDAILAGAA
ncbi:MAG: insulinase family protein [Dehalococcoidia bacterium]|nr:insulinase family protein [Dehalococcoidia bacterium]